MGYYLADGIYPSWATFVKTTPEPQGNKRKYFAKAQEAVRKDVERAFGVLQSRFAIVRGPARFGDQETLGDIMKACVIMHNMIIEDEGEVDPDERFQDGGDNVQPSHDQHPDLDEFIEIHRKIRDKETHHQLQQDLVEHLWQHHSDQY
jgi:glutathione S-transferase